MAVQSTLTLLTLAAGLSQATAGRVEEFEASVGGARGAYELFQSSPEAFGEAVAKYGMAYGEDIDTEARLNLLQSGLEECPRYFPQSLRNTWHDFDGELYYIEEGGRPSRAYKALPPVRRAPRQWGCQRRIGRWGDREDNGPRNFDGGHMIGAQLGGYGGRLNIVPQVNNFNRNNWVRVENKVSDCDRLPNGRVFYQVRVEYPNGNLATVIPETFTMAFEDTLTNASRTINFENQRNGGPNGDSERRRGIAFLDSIGCD